MKDMLRRIRRHRSTLIVGLLRGLTYCSLAVLFFGLMSINNFALLHPSRTLATTALTFIAMLLLMNNVYGGYAVGKKKSKPVISSMCLAIIGTDIITYLQLQIMNVNVNNNAKLTLFGADFTWLLVCVVAQVVVIVIFVRVGNNVFFRLNPPKKCLLVVSSEEDQAHLTRKINRYRLQWSIVGSVRWDNPELVERLKDCEVVFIGNIPERAKMALLQHCYDLHLDVMCKAQLQDIMLSNAKQTIVDDAPFLEMEYRKMTLGQRIAKRCMDIGVSALALIFLLPVLLIIALCIYLEDGGSPFFLQKRMSVNGRVFTIRKFRTMSIAASRKAHQVSVAEGDSRITRVGRFLRRTRLDELPQLWNILAGDMTLVGPRPEMLDNVEKYKEMLPAFVYREKMKAGLTGYAQIEGRYNTTPEDKLMLDLMYIESFSMWLDVKLLFRTLTVFFKSDSTAGFEAQDMTEETHSSTIKG